MKIALLCDDTLDSTDGVQQYVLTLGAQLTREGHEVHYLTSTSHRTDLENLHSLSKRIQTTFNSNNGGMPLPASRKRIKQLLELQRYDIIHIQMPYSPLLAGQVIKYAPKATKIIGTFHIFPQSKIVSVATRLLGLWVHRQLPRFTAVMAVSRAAQDFAKQSFGIDSIVVPNMVDVRRFSVTSQKSQDDQVVKIVFLGRLVERKGSVYLLQALAQLQKTTLDTAYSVTIAGKGPLMPSLVDFTEKNNLEDIVSFPGFILEEAKPQFLADADIAVFPSTGGESFGISLIEAMAATPGPVLAGDNPGYRTVMEGGEQQLVKPQDTEKFAAVLAHYIENRHARAEAHAWQTQHVRQYDTPTVVARIVAVYKDALQPEHK